MTQAVYKSQTRSGTKGYFSMGMLVIELTTDQYNMSEEGHIKYCEQLRFEYKGETK